MAGFPGLTPTSAGQTAANSLRGAYKGLPYGGAGVGPVGNAAREARYAMDTMGVPSFKDIWDKVSGVGGGGFGGIKEFGNSGAAGAGADFAKTQLTDWKSNLSGLQNQISARQKEGYGKPASNVFGGRVGADISEYTHPTSSPAFRAAMGLAREQTGAASAEVQRNAMEASQKRGYFGGYDPRQSDIDRMSALSEAGFAGVKSIRDQALSKYGTDVGGYTSTDQLNKGLAADRYKTDIGALEDQYKTGMSGYQAGLGSYTDLTKTQAELPTKWLSALSPLLSGAMGMFGNSSSFFHDALGADESQRNYNQYARGEQRKQLFSPPGPGGEVRRG